MKNRDEYETLIRRLAALAAVLGRTLVVPWLRCDLRDQGPRSLHVLYGQGFVRAPCPATAEGCCVHRTSACSVSPLSVPPSPATPQLPGYWFLGAFGQPLTMKWNAGQRRGMIFPMDLDFALKHMKDEEKATYVAGEVRTQAAARRSRCVADGGPSMPPSRGF